MLGKLLKYELQATGRIFIPAYIGIVLISIINRSARIIDIAAIFNFTGILLGTLFAALCVITVIVVVQRFYKNLLADEGYLMFTLPVKVESLIGSKLIASMIWGIMSIIVAILACLILFFEGQDFKDIIQGMTELMKYIHENDIAAVIISMILGGLIALAQACQSILTIYFSLAVTQINKLSKDRRLFSFIIYIIINIAVGKLSFWAAELMSPHFFGGDMNETKFLIGLALVFVWTVFLAVAFFAGTAYVLKKHLNLE